MPQLDGAFARVNRAGEHLAELIRLVDAFRLYDILLIGTDGNVVYTRAQETDFGTNLRNGGVPLELKHKIHHQKPKLVIICDVSTSVRPVAEFMLRLVYELQDQIAKARPFIFIDDITDISAAFQQYRPEVAVEMVLAENQPGYYNTNLGNSLSTFMHDHLNAIDHRTSLIFIGDGRNNFSDPRCDLVDQQKRRAKRVVWLSPESPYLWGTGDSDMHAYVPFCNAVHEVANLQQLADAVDGLLG